jgi:hypothetical protein
MSHKVDLPDGGWAEIRDPAELTTRQRSVVRRYMVPMARMRDKFAGMTAAKPDATPEEQSEAILASIEAVGADGLDDMDAMYAAFIVTYLAGWSLDRPLPTTPDAALDLPGSLFDTLTRACINLGDGAVDFSVDGAVDPASPTEPSAG